MANACVGVPELMEETMKDENLTPLHIVIDMN